jgi:hypothetical protein
MALSALLACAAAADTITAVGALGNSGGSGPSLVRVGEVQAETGVAVTADGCVLVSGGDRINRLGLAGGLIESYPLDPKEARATGRTFALVDGRLYFLGKIGERWAIFGLNPAKGEVARPLATPLPPRVVPWWPPALCASPWRGKLLLAQAAAERPPGVAIYAVDPASGACQPWAEVAGNLPAGLALDDAHGVIYLGGRFGEAWKITALDGDGRPLAGDWPTATARTAPMPTDFEGRLSFAAGALWDAGHYGFLARLDRAARIDPGRVVEWQHELNFPTQIVAVPGAAGPLQPLLIGTNLADAIYAADWDPAQRALTLTRRLGALPFIASLTLTPDGWAAVGTLRGTLWWRPNAGPDTPPAKVDMHIATTAGFVVGDSMLALGALYRLDPGQPKPASPLLLTRRHSDRDEARRWDPLPAGTRAAGFCVQPVAGRDEAAAWASDAAGRRLLRARAWLGDPRLDGPWRPVTVEGAALAAPGDLAAVDESHLVLADGGRVLGLAVAGNQVRLAWTFDHWGDRPEQHFGSQIRLAADGGRLLVADTERQRVLWFDLAPGAAPGPPAAQFGQTDRAGDDERHLDRPAQVAIAGPRALVADAGNQRVLKLERRPG